MTRHEVTKTIHVERLTLKPTLPVLEPTVGACPERRVTRVPLSATYTSTYLRV